MEGHSFSKAVCRRFTSFLFFLRGGCDGLKEGNQEAWIVLAVKNSRRHIVFCSTDLRIMICGVVESGA